jgi:sodium-dependent dicarboxylate transporter 2/3/5
VLLYYVSSTKDFEVLDKSFFKEKYKELGAITLEQKRVFVLFIFLVFMWIFEKRYLLAISTFQDGVPYFPSLHLLMMEPSQYLLPYYFS